MQIESTGATLGAFVTGVDLTNLDEGEWRQILDAFHRDALLIFPAQHLSPEAQLDFAKRFGEVEILVENMTSIPISNRGDDGKVLPDDSHQALLLRGNEGWHTDSSYMPLSAKASILSAHEVPPQGGETEWADPRAGYDALDDATRDRIAELAAYHSFFHSQAKIGHDVEVGAGYGFFAGEPPLHPLVKVHSVTGRPALYVGRHIQRIKGLDDDEAATLLQQLTEACVQSERTYRHRWQVGDIAVWDNRCLLHRACDYDRRYDRLMLHTRVKGDPATESALNANRTTASAC